VEVGNLQVNCRGSGFVQQRKAKMSDVGVPQHLRMLIKMMKIELVVIVSILFLFFNGRIDAAGNQNSSKEIEIKAFPGIYGSNCFVVSLNKCGIIIDAGSIDSLIAGYLLTNDIKINYIFCTHSNIDHVLLVMDIKKVTGARIALHSADVNHF
jgi:glyoxylase-like metal-dependent hydrolase (beta-lactamase superfamily II)